MWQVMSSRDEILARAREAAKEKKQKKHKGPLGGCVLERVERVQQRRRVASHATLLPAELLQLICVHAAQPGMVAAHATCVCHAWCSALRRTHVVGELYAFGNCRMLRRVTSPACQLHACRLHACPLPYALACVAKAVRMQVKHMEDTWMDVRVGVPWDVDGPGTVYFGTLTAACNASRCLSVNLVGYCLDRYLSMV